MYRSPLMPQAARPCTQAKRTAQTINLFIVRNSMEQSAFIRAAQAALDELENAFEDAGFDAEHQGNVLDVILPDGKQIVVNIQTPMREIWVASRDGGRHFHLENGSWRDTRTSAELSEYLADIVRKRYAVALCCGPLV